METLQKNCVQTYFLKSTTISENYMNFFKSASQCNNNFCINNDAVSQASGLWFYD